MGCVGGRDVSGRQGWGVPGDVMLVGDRGGRQGWGVSGDVMLVGDRGGGG